MYESTLFTLGLIFFAASCISIGVWLQDKEQKKKRIADEESKKAAVIKEAIQKLQQPSVTTDKVVATVATCDSGDD